MQPNPAWADQLIHDNWSRIETFADKSHLPQLITFAQLGVRASRSPGSMPLEQVSWREYGCGKWGCVYPTMNPAVVCKLTSDPDEIETIMLLSRLQEDPDMLGVVRYYAILRLTGEHSARGEPEPTPVFLVWREAANCGAPLSERAVSHPGAKELQRAKSGKRLSPKAQEALAIETSWQLLYNALVCAEMVGNLLTGKYGVILKPNLVGLRKILPKARAWAEKDADNFLMLSKYNFQNENEKLLPENRPQKTRGPNANAAYLLAGFELILETLAETGIIDRVAEALLLLYQHGILLADVHQDNVCPIRRPDGEYWVITDPGYAVLLGVRGANAPAAKLFQPVPAERMAANRRRSW